MRACLHTCHRGRAIRCNLFALRTPHSYRNQVCKKDFRFYPSRGVSIFNHGCTRTGSAELQHESDQKLIMNIKIKIGVRIKELRMKKGLTQEGLAWKSEVDRTYMNHVENSKRNVSVDTLEKIICQGLECSFKDFFNSNLFSRTNKS